MCCAESRVRGVLQLVAPGTLAVHRLLGQHPPVLHHLSLLQLSPLLKRD